MTRTAHLLSLLMRLHTTLPLQPTLTLLEVSRSTSRNVDLEQTPMEATLVQGVECAVGEAVMMDVQEAKEEAASRKTVGVVAMSLVVEEEVIWHQEVADRPRRRS